jgi:hypothetical protein
VIGAGGTAQQDKLKKIKKRGKRLWVLEVREATQCGGGVGFGKEVKIGSWLGARWAGGGMESETWFCAGNGEGKRGGGLGWVGVKSWGAQVLL